jgi:Predicted transcriptional regulators
MKQDRRGKGPEIARVLRDLRKEARLSVQALGKRAGLAPSTVSKIENDQISPTYDTLLRLADGLSVDIAELFAGNGGMTTGRRAVTRKGQGVPHVTPQYDYEMLCNEIANKRFVPLLATIKAGDVQSFDALLTHPGEEFVYVLEGAVELHSDLYAPLRLEAGDCCYFDSTMGHGMVRAGDTDARVLWVCSRVSAPLRT